MQEDDQHYKGHKEIADVDLDEEFEWVVAHQRVEQLERIVAEKERPVGGDEPIVAVDRAQDVNKVLEVFKGDAAQGVDQQPTQRGDELAGATPGYKVYGTAGDKTQKLPGAIDESAARQGFEEELELATEERQIGTHGFGQNTCVQRAMDGDVDHKRHDEEGERQQFLGIEAGNPAAPGRRALSHCLHAQFASAFGRQKVTEAPGSLLLETSLFAAVEYDDKTAIAQIVTGLEA